MEIGFDEWKERVGQLCKRNAYGTKSNDTTLSSIYITLQNIVVKIEDGSSTPEIARLLMRDLLSELSNQKELLSKYDLEQINKEIRIAEKQMEKRYSSDTTRLEITDYSTLKPQPTRVARVARVARQRKVESTVDEIVNYTINGIKNEDLIITNNEDIVSIHNVSLSVLIIQDRKKSVHLSDISNSLLYLPHVDGSILAHRINQCIIISNCKQFRIHNSSDCLIALRIQSHPVVEHCINLLFTDESIDRNMTPVGSYLKGNVEENRCHEVKDFNWLFASQSPNWGKGDLKLFVVHHPDLQGIVSRYDRLQK